MWGPVNPAGPHTRRQHHGSRPGRWMSLPEALVLSAIEFTLELPGRILAQPVQTLAWPAAGSRTHRFRTPPTHTQQTPTLSMKGHRDPTPDRGKPLHR